MDIPGTVLRSERTPADSCSPGCLKGGRIDTEFNFLLIQDLILFSPQRDKMDNRLLRLLINCLTFEVINIF